jgi:large repetitive protein
MVASTDTGTSNTDNTTYDTTPDFTGTCTDGDIVTLYIDSIAITPTQVCSSGVYNITPATAISTGTHSITSRFSDTAGNITAASPILNFVIDTTAPVTPIAPDITTTTDSGASNGDNITNDTTPDFTGTCSNDDIVTIYVNSNPIAPTQVCSGGVYTITPATALVSGNYTITTVFTDGGGNESAQSPALAITVDTNPLSLQVDKSLTQLTPTAGQPIKFVVQFSEPIDAASFATSDITLTASLGGGGVIQSITQISSTVFEVTVGNLINLYPVNNIVSISIAADTVTDIAGNLNSTSVNGPNPNVTFLVPPPSVNPLIANNATPTLTGQCANNNTITVALTPTVSGSPFTITCSNDNGNASTWSYTLPSAIAQGVYDVKITDETLVIDNNVANQTGSLIIDTLAPAVTIEQKSSQADPTNTMPAVFTVVFSNPIVPSTFVPSTVVLGGTAPGKVITGITQTAPNDGTTFELTVTATGPGTIIATIPASSSGYTASDFATTFGDPTALTIDSSNNIYVGAEGANRVEKITPTGSVSNYGNTTGVNINEVVFDNLGNLYAIANGSGTVEKITSTGVVTTLPGLAAGANQSVFDPITGNIYSSSIFNNKIRVHDSAGTLTLIGSTGLQTEGIVLGLDGNLYTADRGSDTITKTTKAGVSTTFATLPAGSAPYGLTMDSAGNFYTANSGNDTVSKISSTGSVSTLGTTGSSPVSLVVDSVGNIYTANRYSSNVTKITPTGTSSTIASTGTRPMNIIMDSYGNLFTANQLSKNITKISVPSAFAISDAAGNGNTTSTSVDNVITYDNFAPTTPTVNSQITNDNTPTITGNCETGTTINVQVSGQTLNTSCTSGAYSVNVPTSLTDGTYDVVITSTDSAGNSSVDSTINELVIDTAAPSTPISPDMLATTDSGASNTDNNTNDNTPTFTGNCTPNQTITLYLNGTVIGSQVCPANETYSITPTTVIVDGLHNITVTATDLAQNISQASPVLSITIDTTTPTTLTAPTITTPLNDNTPTLTGTCTNGDTITVYEGNDPITPTAVCTFGTYSITLTTPLTDGSHSFTTTATDPAGNNSLQSMPVLLVVDTIAPDAPVSTPTVAALSNINTPTITGTCNPGNTVTAYVDETAILPTQVCTSGGTYNIVPISPIPDDEHLVTITETDPAGNQSQQSPSTAFEIDTNAPIAPTIIPPTSPSNDNTPAISGTGEAGATISVTIQPTGEILTTIVQSDGTWNVTPNNPIPDGQFSIEAKQTDPAGNVSSLISNNDGVTDTTAPIEPIITGPTDGAALTIDTPTFTGTGEANAIVTITDELDTVVCTTVVDNTGNWACTPTSGLGEGERKYTVTLRDEAGNNAPVTNSPTSIVLNISSDGADTSEENAGPNNGDANGDGIQDSKQQNVAAKPNGITEGYATIVVDESTGCGQIKDYNFKFEIELESSDLLFEFPIGLFGFKFKCAAPGATANVKIILDKKYDTSNWQYRKYTNGTYRDITDFVTFNTETIGGVEVTTINFSAQDGGPLDDDGVANGEFVDPNGPAITVLTNPISPVIDTITNLIRTGGSSENSPILICLLMIIAGVSVSYTTSKRNKTN